MSRGETKLDVSGVKRSGDKSNRERALEGEKPKRKVAKPFAKGHAPFPGAGRKKGQVSKITRQLKEAILEAAEVVGFDKKGSGGLVGYLARLAIIEPKSYTQLLLKILPHTLNVKAEIEGEKVYRTHDEIAAKLLEKGLPLPAFLIEGVGSNKLIDVTPTSVFKKTIDDNA